MLLKLSYDAIVREALGILMQQAMQLRRGSRGESRHPKKEHQGDCEPGNASPPRRSRTNGHAVSMKHQIQPNASTILNHAPKGA